MPHGQRGMSVLRLGPAPGLRPPLFSVFWRMMLLIMSVGPCWCQGCLQWYRQDSGLWLGNVKPLYRVDPHSAHCQVAA
jgi:hypothetical protein